MEIESETDGKGERHSQGKRGKERERGKGKTVIRYLVNTPIASQEGQELKEENKGERRRKEEDARRRNWPKLYVEK